LPEPLARKVRFCGYLPAAPPESSRDRLRGEFGIGDRRLVLVTVGGTGDDGYPVFETYLEALEAMPRDLKLCSLLVTGPNLPTGQVRALEARARRVERANVEVRIVEFSRRLTDYVVAADVVLSRGGYNSVTEALSLGTPIVVVPRVNHTGEQMLRASLFERKGLVRMVHPDRLEPVHLARTLTRALESSAPSRAELEAAGVELSGLERIAEYASSLLGRRV
jgi:predicted glycosyltransferase